MNLVSVPVSPVPGEKQTRLVPDRLLPPGAPFQVRIAAPDDAAVRKIWGGSLETWPSGGDRTCDPDPTKPKLSGDRQHYLIALKPSGTGAERVIAGEVPLLQIGTRYCFSVVRLAALTDVELTAVSAAAVPRIEAALLGDAAEVPAPGGPPKPICDFTDAALREVERALRAALASTVDPELTPGDLTPASRTVLTAYRANASARCESVRSGREQVRTLGRAAKDAGSRREAALDRLRSTAEAPLPPPRPGHVLLRLADEPRYVGLPDVARSAKPAELAEALARLEALSRAFPDFRTPRVNDWRVLLEQARELGPEELKRRIAALELPPMPPALWDVLRTPPEPVAPVAFSEPVPPGTTQEAMGRRFASALQQLGALQDEVEADGAATIARFKEAIQSARDAVDGEIQALGKEKAARGALERDTEALRTALRTPLDATVRGPVREDMLLAVRARWADTPGFGTTPGAGYFVAIDTGVAIAFPMVSAASQPWLAPYIGLNFYVEPVDRRISLGSLAGDRRDVARQLLSFTVGTTLTSPGVPSRQTEALVFGAYPLVALGTRLTSYTRVTLGSMWFRVSSANPASAKKKLAWAPFIGVSIDADVLSLIPRKQ